MERIAIIDHSNHMLFVEDISDEDLAKYNGSEQDYINDNFNLEHYSWDYIIEADYLPVDEKNPIEINFKKL